MRTIDRLSSNDAISWMRSRTERLRNLATSRHPLARWALVAVFVASVVGVGYLIATSVSPLAPRWLASGRSFSSDDLLKVLRALDEKRVDYRLDDRRRISVSAEQYDQASAVIAKLDIGAHSVGEIRDETNSWSLLETPREKERRELVRREKILEAMVTKFDDVAWAVVSLRYPQPQNFHQLRGKPSAFVFLETDNDRPLQALTVESIISCLRAREPEIGADSITVMDRRGHPYLEAGKPGQGDLSRTRAREEELREEILQKLNSIKGVEVLVSLTSSRATASPAVKPSNAARDERSSPPKPADGAHAVPEQKLVDGLIAVVEARPRVPRPSKTFIPKIGVNEPLGPLPDQDEDALVAISKSDEPRQAQPTAPKADGEPVPLVTEGGRVVVTVPRSFYYNAIMTTDHREPTHEELLLAASKMEPQIKSKVSLVVQDSAAWKIEIYTNPDHVDFGRRAMLASSEQRRKVLDWGLVGASAAAVAILVAVASWIQVARSPGRRSETVRGTRRYHADSPTAPAPSERVRELVKRNPETAASVLQRWTAQGGGLS